MPNKPKAMIKDSNGKLVPNKRGMAGMGLRKYGNPEIITYALEQWTEDVEAGRAQRGRYGRVRAAIVAKFHCSHDCAEEALKGARAYNADMFAAERLVLVPEICAQLQRIADANETEEPAAAVAALREINKMIGAHAPRKVDVTHGVATEVELRSLIGILDDQGRAALDIVIAQYQAAQKSGRLQLEATDDIEDAEIIVDGSN